jgi:ribosome-binding protein aMBF1 (putative translation factor)
MSTSVPSKHKTHDNSRRATPPPKMRVPVDLVWLDAERTARGWAKKTLALKMDVTPETISELYGRGWTSPKTYRKLTEALAANLPTSLDAHLIIESAKAGAA